MSKLISIRAYFADMNLEEQIDFCETNDYLFNKYGELIRHLEE